MGEHLPTVRPDYRTLFTARYGGAFDLTHEFDLACWFAGGQEIREVRSIHGQMSDVDMEAPDVAETVIRFGDRCVASVHVDFFSRPRYRLTELLGTEGTMTVEFSTWERSVVSVYEAGKGRWETETLATERDHMFRAEDREFLAAAETGATPPLGVAEAGKSLRIVCAAMGGGLPASI
jgi:predicted dehydrogenase